MARMFYILYAFETFVLRSWLVERTAMLIEFDAAHDAMGPYFDRLWDVINGSWKDWNTEVSPKVRAIASTRSRACLVNDFMRTRGTRLTVDDPNVTVVMKQQMFVLVFSPPGFEGSIGVRLKKLDEDGLSRNQPTGQVHDYRGQLSLPGIKADYHLEAGYVVDRFGSALSSVDLVCPAGNAIHWKAEIIPNGATQNVSNLFFEEDSEKVIKISKKPREEPKTVKVRRKDEKEVGESDGTDGKS